MTTTTKRAPARTAQQIAQDKVDKAQAKVAALTDRAQSLRTEIAQVDERLALAEKRLQYLKSDPDLTSGHDPAQTSIDDVLGEEPLPEGGEPA